MPVKLSKTSFFISIKKIVFSIIFNTDHLCKRNEFKCKNGRCVSVDLICNSQNDCYDNSDENFCCTKFTCDNRRCISEEQRCNNINNCGDWSDEKNCNGSCPFGLTLSNLRAFVSWLQSVKFSKMFQFFSIILNFQVLIFKWSFCTLKFFKLFPAQIFLISGFFTYGIQVTIDGWIVVLLCFLLGFT